MTIVNLNTDRIDRFLARLKQLDLKTFRNIVEHVAVRLGLKAEEVASTYPEVRRKKREAVYPRTRKDGSTYMSKWKSAKQQAFVYFLGLAGKIPYRRTGRLGQSINSSVSVNGNTYVITVGTNDAKAVYVIGDPVEGQQAYYHRGNWTPLSESINQAEPQLIKQAEEDFGDAVSAYFPS